MKLLSGAFGSWRPRAALSPRIETGRLVLRPLEPVDAEAIAVYLGDIEVARWLVRVPHPFSVEDAADFINQCCTTASLGTATTLGLVVRGDDRAILRGIVALHSLDTRPEIGFWLGRPFWGHGLMSEAVDATLTWAYASLDVDAIAAGAFQGNVASLTIQARQGFEVVGMSRRPSLIEERLLDHVDTRLTRARHAARPWRP
jgi:RimJ/RimL family protein N-acetyltransferase